MSLGKYSVVRFADPLSDQRVNLGVIVWGPNEGFSVRYAHSLGERLSVIDPNARVAAVKEQLEYIGSELEANRGRPDLLDDLSRMFREGLQVTQPYPARAPGSAELLDRLFETMVSAEQFFSRATAQATFAKALGLTLKGIANESQGAFETLGEGKVNGVSVRRGFRLTIKKRKPTIWHPLSLHAVPKSQVQLALSKSLAMDIQFARKTWKDFAKDDQVVLLQLPKRGYEDASADAIAWLKYEADIVRPVTDTENIPSAVKEMLSGR